MVDISRRTDLLDRFINFTDKRYNYFQSKNVTSLIRVLATQDSQTFKTEVEKGILKNSTEAIALHIPYEFGQPVLLDQEFSEEPQEIGQLFLSLYSINLITALNYAAAVKPKFIMSIFILRPGSGGGQDLFQVQAMYQFQDVSIMSVYDYAIYKVLSCRFLRADYVVHKYDGDVAAGKRTFSINYKNFTTTLGEE